MLDLQMVSAKVMMSDLKLALKILELHANEDVPVAKDLDHLHCMYNSLHGGPPTEVTGPGEMAELCKNKILDQSSFTFTADVSTPSGAYVPILVKTPSYEGCLATFIILIKDALNKNLGVVKHPVVMEAGPRVTFQQKTQGFSVDMEYEYWTCPISLAPPYALKLQFEEQSVAIFFIMMLMLQLTSALEAWRSAEHSSASERGSGGLNHPRGSPAAPALGCVHLTVDNMVKCFKNKFDSDELTERAQSIYRGKADYKAISKLIWGHFSPIVQHFDLGESSAFCIFSKMLEGRANWGLEFKAGPEVIVEFVQWHRHKEAIMDMLEKDGSLGGKKPRGITGSYNEPFEASLPPIGGANPSLGLKAVIVHSHGDRGGTLFEPLVDREIARETDAGHPRYAEYMSSRTASHLNDAVQHLQLVLDHAGALTNLTRPTYWAIFKIRLLGRPDLASSLYNIMFALAWRYSKERTNGFAVIDADPYTPNGWDAQRFINQNNFYRSIRNLIIDLRQITASTSAIGLHWQVSQGTSLIDIVVEMSTASNNNHKGMFMENGSGGFMGDIIFNGVGNQQFTVRNLTVNHAATGSSSRPSVRRDALNTSYQPTAVSGICNWGSGRLIEIYTFLTSFQGSRFKEIRLTIVKFVGLALASGGTTTNNQTVGSEAIADAVLINVPTAVGAVGGITVLAGGTATIASWGQGNVYSGTSVRPSILHKETSSLRKHAGLLDISTFWCSGHEARQPTTLHSANKPSVLLDSAGRILGKDSSHAKSQGAKGDGHTDDTAAIQNILNEVDSVVFFYWDRANNSFQYAGYKIIFFDAGTYYVTNAVAIPA
ncbi:pectate lyase superfamily protein-domain-containing protein [Suillus lakei]|nr:pectate lyase superfamily protein-domain-containing protein [Suillus lakei]